MHAGDALFGSEAALWAGIYDVAALTKQFGWALDGFARDAGMLFVVGAWMRGVALICLVAGHRHMQA